MTPLRYSQLPVLRALAAQVLALPATALLLALLPFPRGIWLGALAQGAFATFLGSRWGLGVGWRLFQALLPLALAWQLERDMPGWIFGMGLLLLLLVFGGGLRTRAPLYHSNRAAWAELEALLPAGRPTFVDLGAGLGGAMAYLARRRPEACIRGVEASPLTWLGAWLRCLPTPARVRLGSLWAEDLSGVDVAFAFLSPAPMADVWDKVQREMRPGTLFISHTFEVPGVTPFEVRPLPGRPGACLRLYRVPPAP